MRYGLMSKDVLISQKVDKRPLVMVCHSGILVVLPAFQPYT